MNRWNGEIPRALRGRISFELLDGEVSNLRRWFPWWNPMRRRERKLPWIELKRLLNVFLSVRDWFFWKRKVCKARAKFIILCLSLSPPQAFRLPSVFWPSGSHSHTFRPQTSIEMKGKLMRNLEAGDLQENISNCTKQLFLHIHLTLKHFKRKFFARNDMKIFLLSPRSRSAQELCRRE